MYTIKDLVRRAVIVNPDGAALVGAESALSWSALQERVASMASRLVERGLAKGDRVAVISLNSARFFEMIYAVLWAGGIVAPINTRYARREVQHCLQDLDGVWICTDQANLETVEAVRPNVEGLRGLIYIGDGACPAGYLGLDELRGGDSSRLIDDPQVDDVAMIYFTGGTTGVSKGVMLTHGQILTAAQQSAAGVRSIDGEAVYLHVAPMFHMGDGVMCFVSAMTTCANAFIDRFEMTRFVEICNRDRVTWATMVPTMVRGLCLHIKTSGQRIPTLEGIIYGGSRCRFFRRSSSFRVTARPKR